MDAATARCHLEQLATTPRPAGSEREAAARRYCGDVLTGLGFDVNAEPFTYSAAPGKWATPAGGVIFIVALWVASHLGSRGGGREALVVLGATLLVAVPLALWTARHGVLALPFVRRRGENLVATRGGRSPAVWLVAHLDSKSQPVPTAARAGGIVLSGIVWGAAICNAAVQWRGVALDAWGPFVAVAGALAALPVVASVVGERSPGALDNASGVATVLVAAGRLVGAPVGVLLTSGEELGLAGARAWAAAHPAGLALNCDGIDDAGSLVCMHSGGSRESRAVAAYAAGAAQCGVALRVRGLVPGLLVDAVALSDAGWDAATLSRGNWRTLARVHRPSDDLEHLAGTGIAEAAGVMAAAAANITMNQTP